MSTQNQEIQGVEQWYHSMHKGNPLFSFYDINIPYFSGKIYLS